jgi:glutamine synthetase
MEWRLPDPSCNVYAAIAGTLSAGLLGIERALSAPPPCADDLYVLQASGAAMPPRLPKSLDAAIDALEADTALTQAVGGEFCSEFIRLKRAEWDSYNQHVSAWEQQRYANAF